jgi:preprotein translocase subunit SecD
MNRSLWWKFGIIAALVLGSLFAIFGLPKSMDEATANVRKNINLGLDLRGGTQLILQVQVQDAFKAEAAQLIDQLRTKLNEASINYNGFDASDPQRIEDAGQIAVTARGVDAAKATELRRIVNESFPAWVVTPQNATDYVFTMKPTDAISLKQRTVEAAVRTIQTRVDSTGLAEASVTPRGKAEEDAQVLVQLPGVDDPLRIKELLGRTAALELSGVREGPFPSREAALSGMGGVLPMGTRLVKAMGRGADGSEGWYLLERVPVVTGRDLRDARAQQNGVNTQWETSFVLSQAAADRFERYTEANVGKRLAIVLDNVVRSAPTIESKIRDQGVINGARDQIDASDLALVLRSGALPASIIFLEERSVGPSLGADSIRQGLVAGVAGVAAVVLVMLVYYKKAGINATIALVLNALFLIAALAMSGATLTLPGIAGIILTIGMAVDSNVLIFERIREELRTGKSVRAAVDAGFGRAWLTIIDTHVTTVVSSLFLFIFGTPNIKGFAITLVAGLLINVFTAVWVSRVLFEWVLSRDRKLQTLSI